MKILSNNNEVGYTKFISSNTTTFVVDADKDKEITVLNEMRDDANNIFDISATVLYGTNIFSIVEDSEKISPKLFDTEFLEKEKYIKDGKVPVIIQLNVENNIEEKKEEKGIEENNNQKIVLGTRADIVSNEKPEFDEAKQEVLEELGVVKIVEENVAENEDDDGIAEGNFEIAGEEIISGTDTEIVEDFRDSEGFHDSNEIREVKDLKIINSIAIEVEHDKLNELSKLDSVKKIELDERVQILLSDSVPLINATNVWKIISNGTNVTGANITIAIIDTGVDYTHPDLGGCLGSGCKVAGGYDFINNDNDPMDDHGHGTHVAATAASNGLKGVAPDAKIYAYKVLNSGGSGSYSSVISGVERATDPNNDGNYSDHVNIISMSLGGYGDEDTSLSLAVDTAVNRGVVAVVAAGNSGTSTNAIGSPASSRKALTVAATDKSDALAYFSSRGPTSKFNLKPDLAAPGVSICAAQWDSAWSSYRCYDNRHVSISGTSMATPHVSGAAALILQMHPTWTPEMVKSVLMSTAKDLNLKAWEQGTGRIDALKAINASVAFYPQSISFGQVSQENISQIITIQNIYNASVFLNMSPGIVKDEYGNNYNIASLNVTSMTINANTNKTINLSIAIGNLSGTFYGYMNISDGYNIYRIPYLFIRLTRLTVTVTNGSSALSPVFIIIHNSNLTTIKYAGYWDFAGNSYTFNVQPGSYVIHAIGDYTNRNLVYILTGNTTASIGASSQIDLDIADANVFNVSATGINGETLSLYKWQYLLEDAFESRRFTTSMTYLGIIFDGNRTVYVSSTANETANTSISLSYIGYPYAERPSYISSTSWGDRIFNSAPRLYFMGWIINNLTRSWQLSPSETLVNYTYSYNYPGWNPDERASFDSYISIQFWISPLSWFDLSPWIQISSPLKRTNYIMNMSWGYWHYMHINYLRDSSISSWQNEFAAAAGQEEKDKSFRSAWPRGSTSTNARNPDFGTSYMPTYFRNTNNTIVMEDYVLNGFNNETYVYKDPYVTWQSSTGESGTVYLPTPNILIYRNGVLVSNSTPTNWKTFSYSASSGNYIVNISIPTAYPLYNVTYITANFTLPYSDTNPPKLTYINVTPRFELNNPFAVQFNITDESVFNVSAYYSLDRTIWTQIPMTNTSSRYNGSVTITNSSNEMSLKIIASDTSGNEVTYRIVPISMPARNTALNFASSKTTANRADEISFSGTVRDTTNSQNINQARIEYYINDSFYRFDMATDGIFNFRYTIPSDYSSNTISFTVLFNGTGVHKEKNESIQINVNIPLSPAQQVPQYSNLARTPNSPDADDNINISVTWTSSTAIDRVLFESNYTGAWLNYPTTNTSNVYNHTISNAFLSAGKVIGYKFNANNTAGTNSTTLQSFTVQEIAADLTAGEALETVNINQSNTLWCDYFSGNSTNDILNATVKAEIDNANNTMSYNSTSGRYEYTYSTNATGTKTWKCLANKTNYQTKSTTSSFSVGEQEAPSYANITRTSDPIYSNMTVVINTTWTDNTGLSRIILSSNFTGSWLNYTIAVNPPIPYTASYNISNLINSQAVGWKYIANDTAGNTNNLMPAQTFAVQNRAPSTVIDYNDNKGWGENWTFIANVSDSDNDTLNVSIWTKYPGGSFVFRNSTLITNSINSTRVNFTIQLNSSYIGSGEFMINVSDGRTSSAVNATITVEKDDVLVTINSGINESVQRYGTNTITLGINIYDTDRGEYANITGKIYWTKSGSLPYDNEQECTASYGNCSVSVDPNDVYTVGAQYFYGGTLSNDSYYKQANSSQHYFVVNGTIFASVDGPAGSFNYTAMIYLNTTITDDTSNKLSADNVYLEYKHTETVHWNICSPVVEQTEANYYCILNASSMDLGSYGIRYHAEKVNYTSINTTVLQQFVVARVMQFNTRANFTANVSKSIRANEINTTFEILANTSLANIDINVTFNSTNPRTTNLSVAELGKYISINVSNELESNLSHVIIKINYTDEEINNTGLVEDSLRIYYYNGTAWTPYDPPYGGVNTTENYVWANVTHFSDFGVGGKKSDNLSCSSNDECNSGNCAVDYDEQGKWCAPSGNCGHDYSTAYSNGATTCYGNYKETCASGNWTATLCSGGCSSGVCITTTTATVSGGGGGGAVESTKIQYYKDMAKITIPSISANETKLIEIKNMTESDINNISITVKNKANKIELSIIKLMQKPANITDVSGKIYRYIQIDKENITDSDIKDVKISFFIKNSWIDENKINESTISLDRYGNAWEKLTTKKLSKDRTYTYFEADSSGLSVFAITGEELKIELCGNGFIEAGEECDDNNLAGQSCESMGFASGALGCKSCKFDTSSCIIASMPVCGDGICEQGDCFQDCMEIVEHIGSYKINIGFNEIIIIAIIIIVFLILFWIAIRKPFKKRKKQRK